jgi:hypothetical protein
MDLGSIIWVPPFLLAGSEARGKLRESPESQILGEGGERGRTESQRPISDQPTQAKLTVMRHSAEAVISDAGKPGKGVLNTPTHSPLLGPFGPGWPALGGTLHLFPLSRTAQLLHGMGSFISPEG